MKEIYKHECEVCKKIEFLTLEDGFNDGWDMPPRMGEWGVISPRTCGSCGIEETAWWFIITNPGETIPEKHLETIRRIKKETGIPDSIKDE